MTTCCMARKPDRSEFPKYCISLLQQLEERTGVPLAVTGIQTPRPFEPHVEVASGDAPAHRVIYWSGAERHRTHYAVTAAYKVLRLWEAPEEDRKVPVLRVTSSPRQWREQFTESFPDPAVAFSNAAAVVVGMAQQVTHNPLDLRVERDVRRDVGRHRIAQQKFIRDQAVGAVTALRRPVYHRLPEEVQRLVAALHLAYMRCAAGITEIEDLSFLFPGYTDETSLNELVGQFHESSKKPGHSGDRALIDSWATTLNLRSWYEWRPLRLAR